MRYHSLDALRAAMMLLGIVLHSAASYTARPLGWAWPYQDSRTSVAFDLTILFIHLFRMPVFFFIAGFFAALLYYRDGVRGFLGNRAKRVLVPLLLFWPSVLPLVGLAFVFSARQADMDIRVLLGDGRGSPLRLPILGHLWFLYYLLIFYAAAAVFVPLLSRLPAALQQRTHAAFRLLTSRTWGAAGLGLITAVTLLPMQGPGLDTAPSVLPPLRILLAYAVFFAAGWTLYLEREAVPTFAARWKRAVAAAALTSVAYLFVVVAQKGFTDARVWHVTAVTIAGVAIWCWTYALMGVFVRYFEAPRPVVRYMSDASYWMYVTHLIPTALIPGLLASLPAPAAVKFLIVVSGTTLLTLVTYHFLVRSTVIGELLNGRRYPRRLPAARTVIAST